MFDDDDLDKHMTDWKCHMFERLSLTRTVDSKNSIHKNVSYYFSLHGLQMAAFYLFDIYSIYKYKASEWQ